MPRPGMTTEDTMNTQTTPVTLTESQRLTLSDALRVAASHFDVSAVHMDRQGFSDAAVMFTMQAAESRELAELIENAEYITLGTSEKS